MTEEDAKATWCPFIKGEDGSGESAATCLGSACMAWRWRTVPNPAWQPANQMAMYPQPNPYSDPNPSGIPSTTDGYCGLAGHQ